MLGSIPGTERGKKINPTNKQSTKQKPQMNQNQNQNKTTL